MSNSEKDERLLKTAVAFLNNPKVESAPEKSKREFLKKKGKVEYPKILRQKDYLMNKLIRLSS
jgi:hypothetical protein